MAETTSWPIMGMTLDEAAAALRVDRRSVISAIKNNGLPCRKVGRSYRISRNALENWLASGKLDANDADCTDCEE